MKNNRQLENRNSSSDDVPLSTRISTKDDTSETTGTPLIVSSVDEGISATGGFGLFQKLVTVVLILGYMTGELFV